MDKFWQRSGFGSFLFIGGSLLIGWLYGRIPEEHDLIDLLGLILVVAGYQHFRPTAGMPNDLPLQYRVQAMLDAHKANEKP